jgi:hypothetical protein
MYMCGAWEFSEVHGDMGMKKGRTVLQLCMNLCLFGFIPTYAKSS